MFHSVHFQRRLKYVRMKWLIYLLLVNCVSASNVKKNSVDHHTPAAINAVLDILKVCDLDVKKMVIGLIDPSNSLTAALFMEPITYNVVVTGWVDESLALGHQTRDESHKLRYVIITVSDESLFRQHIHRYKYSSAFQDISVRFIILENEPSNCEAAPFWLQTFWNQDNILNVIFICESRSAIKYYTSNPFSRIATSPSWEFVDEETERTNERPISIFRHVSRAIDSCSSLFFEKVKHLDGHLITANARHFPPLLSINHNSSAAENAIASKSSYYWVDMTPQVWNQFSGHDRKVIETFVWFVNATMKTKVYIDDEALGYVDDNNSIHGMLQDFVDETADIGMNTRYWRNKGNVTLAYPFGRRFLVAITRHRGYTFFSIAFSSPQFLRSVLWNFVAFSISFIFLAFIANKSFGAAASNIYALILGQSILKHGLVNWPVRMFFGCLILGAMIVSFDFQSGMTSAFTYRHAHKHIDTLEDIQEHINQVYTPRRYLVFTNEHFNLSAIGLPEEECIQKVLADERNACVHDTVFANYQRDLHRGNLYVMKKPYLMTMFLTYSVRTNWPLLVRFENYLERLKENGFLKLWITMNEESLIFRRLRKRENRRPTAISLERFSGFITVWCTGLGIAIAVFLIELVLTKINQKYRNNYLLFFYNKLAMFKLNVIGRGHQDI